MDLSPTLDDHGIMKVSLASIRGYIQRSSPTEKAEPTPEELYALDVFDRLVSVVDCTEQLSFSIELLSGYRAKLRSVGMDRLAYIRFGVENFYLRSTSVLDRCLRLTNAALALGLPDRECNERTIVKNAHVKRLGLGPALRRIDHSTKDLRQPRNEIAHGAGYSDDSLRKLGPLAWAVTSDEFKDTSGYPAEFKRRSDQYVDQQKTDLRAKANLIVRSTRSFFDELQPVLAARLDETA